MHWVGLLVAFAPGEARPYVGPNEVHAAAESLAPAESPHVEAARPTPIPAELDAPRPTRTTPVAPTPLDPGERWRLAVLLSTHGFVDVRDTADVGGGLGGFLGAGVPTKQRRGRRTRHAFGYAGDVFFSAYDGVGHRHRIAATGLVGSNTPLGRRKYAFYYFAGFGAGIHHVQDAGPSVGVRVGLASSQRLDYILAIGGDLDVLVTRYPDERGIRRELVLALPSINLSLLTFGSL